MFPDEEEGHSFEGVDEREEETVDEEVVVVGTETVQRSHYVDQDLTELVLTRGSNAGALEESNQKFHHLVTVLDQYTRLALNQLNDLDWSLLLQQLLQTTLVQTHSAQQLQMALRVSRHNISLLIPFQNRQ